MLPSRVSASRRRLLQFIAASPLIAPDVRRAWAQGAAATGTRPPDPMVWAALDPSLVIARPEDAINIFDFEVAARNTVPPAHFGYMAGGVEAEVSLRANREGFTKFQLRPRRLNDVSKLDMSMSIFGQTWGSPVYIAPVGGCMAYHPEAEVAVAHAAQKGNHLQMLSSFANTAIEDAIEARGAPVVFQLYPTRSYDVAKSLCLRAKAAGSQAIAVTVDRVSGRRMETQERLARQDTRTCTDCHDNSSVETSLQRKVNFDRIDFAAAGIKGVVSDNVTWDRLKRLHDDVKMPMLIKGVMTPEDAELCVRTGFDGMIVSNHGGRAEDSGLSTIEALEPILAAVKGRIPVLVDSGFRRGADVVKALAMGATAVGVGRPYLWGLGSFGQEGVEQVLAMIHGETRVAMAQCGAASIKQLTPGHVRHI
ncbi:MAG: alpha-hydroxy-acid oxidizing protein [Rhodobacteraceae bacterium]|nr:alpha-hydroxy-acid oxidizing protein [Paracoccaceae bacterium]